MKILFYKIFPIFVFYTELFVPMGGTSYTFGPFCFILIKPKYRNDEGLLNHELTHIKQHWKSYWGHSYKYNNSDKYRYESELEAYAVQYLSYPDKQHFDLFIEFMLEKYKFTYGKRAIEGELKAKLKKLGHIVQRYGPTS